MFPAGPGKHHVTVLQNLLRGPDILAQRIYDLDTALVMIGGLRRHEAVQTLTYVVCKACTGPAMRSM